MSERMQADEIYKAGHSLRVCSLFSLIIPGILTSSDRYQVRSKHPRNPISLRAMALMFDPVLTVYLETNGDGDVHSLSPILKRTPTMLGTRIVAHRLGMRIAATGEH